MYVSIYLHLTLYVCVCVLTLIALAKPSVKHCIEVDVLTLFLILALKYPGLQLIVTLVLGFL